MVSMEIEKITRNYCLAKGSCMVGSGDGGGMG